MSLLQVEASQSVILPSLGPGFMFVSANLDLISFFFKFSTLGHS